MSAITSEAATKASRPTVGAALWGWASIIAGRRRTALVTGWRTRIVTRRRATVVTGWRRPWPPWPKIPPSLPERARRRRGRRPTVIAFDAEHAPRARIGIKPKHATVGGHPFEAITGISPGSPIRPLRA